MIRKATLLISGALLGAIGAVAVTQPQIFTGGAANAAASDTYKDLNLFGDVFERVKADYVEVPDDTMLVQAAINGMLASLDPHSSYLSPKDFQAMQVQTSGQFGGLGIEVTMDQNGLIKVISPIDGTPAAAAGILTNDQITAIDGTDVSGLTLDQAVDKMRGGINTPITLTIARQGVDKPFDVKMVRAEIKIDAVNGAAKGDIGYIRITSFSEQTFDGLKKNIDTLTQQIGTDKLKGWIIDLRNNPGGLLDQAVQVSDAFLNSGEIVSTRGRNPDQGQRYDAKSGDLTNGKPVIVLVNGGTASASEIVSGALQDHARATILGTQSFGKGSVQTIIPLGANGALRLTTARYYTPSGRSIQAQGITPDIKVDEPLPPDLAAQVQAAQQAESNLKGHLANPTDGTTPESAGSLAYVPPDPKDDLQLNQAIALLDGVQTSQGFPPNPNRGIPN
jgi:carboxyl-terminal processing protease